MKSLTGCKAILVISAAICIVLMAFIAGCASTKHNEVNNEAPPEAVYEWGELEQQKDTEKGEPVILAEHFTIYSNELSFLAEKLSLTNTENASDVAAEMLIEKYALFCKAQEAGLLISDSQLEDVIQKQIKVFEETESKEYDEFLAGIGMTNEEYWNSRKEEVKITESIAAWKDRQFEEYTRSYAEDADQPTWETYFEELKNSIIEEENVRYQNS